MRLRLLRRVSLGLRVLLLLTTSKANFAQDIASAKPDTDRTDAKNAELKAPSAGGPSYKIGVGDVLQVSVWEEPQFTESAVVRPDGMISIPLVSEAVVAGLTPESAQTMLAARLERFLHKPRVTVIVQEIHSRMVYITGEVQRPGAYPLIDTMNVVQLVSRSGGLTDFARSKQVYVLRAGSGARVKVDYRRLLKGQSPEQNVELTPGDTVVVP